MVYIADVYVLGISGSPRKNGNTDTAVRETLSMIQRLRDVEIEFIHLSDMRIDHCRGCRSCRETWRCEIDDDDYALIAEKIYRAKALIVGTPVYYHGPPGGMKDLIDRTYVFYTRPRYFKGRKAGVITVSGGEGIECCEEILRCWLNYNGVEILDTIHIYAIQKGELQEKPEELKKIQDLARLVANHL